MMNTKTLLTLLLMLLVCGCSQNTIKLFPVSGTLTLRGEPLSDVRIEFTKTDTGAFSFAEADAQGRFTLRHTLGKPGAEPGTYRISVFRKGKPLPPPSQEMMRGDDPWPTQAPDEPILMSDGSLIDVVVTNQGPNEFAIDIK